MTISRIALAAVIALASVAGAAGAVTAPTKSTNATKAATKSTKATTPKKATAAKKVIPLPRPRPAQLAKAPVARPPIAAAIAPALPPAIAPPTPPAALPAATAALAPVAVPAAPLAMAPTSGISPDDVAALKQAVALIARGKISDAADTAKTITDPLARKLVEWVLLRSDDGGADFNRYAAFIAANPSWPSLGLLRRRAEGALWDENRDAATVRAFFAHAKPISAKGRFALARALIAAGDAKGAESLVREAWRNESFPRELEAKAGEIFRDILTRADIKARMDRRLYAEDTEAGLRLAQRLGGADLAIAKARIAVIGKAGNAGKLLDAVPADARRDAGYLFSRIQWLRRHDKIAEAAQLMLAAPHEAAVVHDTDQWWIERRLIARKLLDANDFQAAYRIARDAAPPSKENYRVEHQFTAGWIALRFLNDPATALAHFSRMTQGVSNPIALARSGYWQGRALEALSRRDEARAQYQAASQYATAYYGQLARARLGLSEIALNPPPMPSAERRAALLNAEVVRATALLYAIDARDLVIPMVIDLAERVQDVGALVLIAEIVHRHNDARALLLLGKTVLGRGYAFDHFAFPDIGVPSFAAVAPEIDRSIVYAIVRQESAFNQRTVSTANALGLMQVTPAAGRDTAKRFGVAFDQRRLLSDPVYNAQMGSAELAGLMQDYRGSYVLTFAGYNAGRGSVRKWLESYGDPRDPGVDPVDWVERIPFSETRNYVQRVMENLQVYRLRFGGGSRLMIEADLRAGAAGN